MVAQETGLTLKGPKDENKFLQSVGRTAVCGAPCPQTTINRGGRSVARACTGIGKQGGVGILCEQSLGLSGGSRPLEEQYIHQTGRWTRAAISLGQQGAAAKRLLHVIAVYNYSGRDAGPIKTNKERLLLRVLPTLHSWGNNPFLFRGCQYQSRHVLCYQSCPFYR